MAVYLLLAWYTYQNALIAHDQHTPVLDIPYSVGYGILAVGLLLVGLSSVAAIVNLTLGGAGAAGSQQPGGPRFVNGTHCSTGRARRDIKGAA